MGERSDTGRWPGGRRPPVRRRLAVLLRVAVAVALLAWLFSRVPLASVLEAVSRVEPAPLVFVIGIALLSQVVLAWRLVLVAGEQGISLTLRRAFAVNLSALFYGLFVPGGNLSRGAIRAYKLARKSTSALQSVACVLFDRLSATVALGFVGLLFWLLERPVATVPFALAFAGTSAVPVVFHLIAVSSRSGASFPMKAGGRSLARRFASVTDSLRRFRDMPAATLGLVLATSVAAQLFRVLVYYALALALQIDISLVSIGWVSSAATLITMLPITPAGLGVREGALVYLLGLYAVPGAQALGLSFLFFAVMIVLTGLLGGLIEAGSWLGRTE